MRLQNLTFATPSSLKPNLHLFQNIFCPSSSVSPCRKLSSFPLSMSAARVVSPAWLNSQITSASAPELTIIDVRGRVSKPGGRVSSGLQPIEYISDDGAYFAGHIPGAAFVDWRKINLGNPAQLCDMFSERGVNRKMLVCVYDWGNMLFATRVWWALKSVGCEDVAVLDRGWKGWDEFGGEVGLETLCPLKVYSEMDWPGGDVVGTVGLEHMRGVLGEEVVLIDARSETQFKGVERRSRRAGHLPGAVNVPYRSLLREEGIGLKSDQDLRQILEGKGVLGGARKYVVYCNGGVSSTLVVFALVRCGVSLESIQNYCGSFNEWGNLDDTPLVQEVGAEEIKGF